MKKPQISRSNTDPIRVISVGPWLVLPALEKRKSAVQTSDVRINAASDKEALLNDKEIVMDLLQRLPDDVTLYQIAQKLEFIAAVRQGLAEFDENKDSISIEQVERELTSWSVTVGRKRRGRRKSQRAAKPKNSINKARE